MVSFFRNDLATWYSLFTQTNNNKKDARTSGGLCSLRGTSDLQTRYQQHIGKPITIPKYDSLKNQ